MLKLLLVVRFVHSHSHELNAEGDRDFLEVGLNLFNQGVSFFFAKIGCDGVIEVRDEAAGEAFCFVGEVTGGAVGNRVHRGLQTLNAVEGRAGEDSR